MAKLTTASGLLVRFDDEWLSIVLNARGDEFYFFLTASVASSERGRCWWGVEKRHDEQGRAWNRQIKRLVVDDFGALVEVPA